MQCAVYKARFVHHRMRELDLVFSLSKGKLFVIYCTCYEYFYILWVLNFHIKATCCEEKWRYVAIFFDNFNYTEYHALFPKQPGSHCHVMRAALGAIRLMFFPFLMAEDYIRIHKKQRQWNNETLKWVNRDKWNIFGGLWHGN